MATCHLNPGDKKAFIGAVGEELVQRHGKQKYYKPDDIRRVATARGYSIDWICWAQCIFSSMEDFDAWHKARGETCDYVEMKSEVLEDLAGSGGFQWPDVDLSWLEWPDIDLSGLFDWFDWSP